MKRVLITGSRDWDDWAILSMAMNEEWWPDREITIVHGACPTGADKMADEWCWLLRHEPGVIVERHPADWDRYGRKAGPIRNAEMVNLGADVCLAFHKGSSNGTANCIRLAQAVGIPVKVWTA